jgi:hypothetical protein
MNPRSLLFTLSILLLPFLSVSAAVPSNWAAGDYAVGSLVIHEGTTYIATQQVTSNEGAPTSATAYWSSLDTIAGVKSTPTGQPSATPDTSSLSGLSVPSDTNETSSPRVVATQIAVSSRGFCGPLASDPLIVGFFVSGTTPKSVVVFAKGPSLPAADVANPLSDPSMYIVNGLTGAVVGGPIDNWGDGPDASIISNLAQVPGSTLDSAIILRDLEPGPYSAIAYHTDQVSTGTALVEVYEFDDGSTEDAKFEGLSTRGFCGPLASDPRIVGFIVGGDEGETIDLFIAAKGPSLPANEVANPLPDPAIYIVNGLTGALVAGPFDNWSDEADAATITSIGRAPGSALDAALILRDLPPGPYTAIAYDNDQTSTGTVLVEVYEVDLGE